MGGMAEEPCATLRTTLCRHAHDAQGRWREAAHSAQGCCAGVEDYDGEVQVIHDSGEAHNVQDRRACVEEHGIEGRCADTASEIMEDFNTLSRDDEIQETHPMPNADVILDTNTTSKGNVIEEACTP
ncbi:hypothetical protein GN244_ATG09876 [Phytophthora infestans]|uniref:Uncharacterized protein n=1 Tax=Phytophthora infestans TaxID=4787 RepID=A0A833SAB4_PHYIN|nr:hypothetical protein GN244_ATG09876 [Phytophthora infestans]KAF4145303.1 hypothetical protein GN958_ATG05492 [Phytophthora infestans]